MKRYIVLILCLFFIEITFAQIANFNDFPTLKPSHILDENLTDISFAFSMRVIVSDYDGPLVRLRRANDNAVQDFGWTDNDIVDVNAINTWRGGSNVFIEVWFDQSGLGRNAAQTAIALQPQFYPNATLPYFQGDGSNDYLLITTANGIQDLTNAGSQGSVLGVIKATNLAQHTFGVLTSSNRWSTHINWIDGNLYFDPGICCNSTRAFSNTANVNLWKQYTFVKTSTNAIARSSGVQRFNGAHTTGRCTVTSNFTICWANGNTSSYSTSSFNELIMYRTDISTTLINDIEQDTMTFWGI